MEIKLFLGAVEITELEERKFILQNINHLRDTYPPTSSHGFEIEVWIDVEVSHLDQIEVRFSNQFYQSLHFFLSICEPREDEEIDRSVDSFSFGPNQGIYHCPKGIPFWPVIAFVEF
jgi:hypothetical protein